MTGELYWIGDVPGSKMTKGEKYSYRLIHNGSAHIWDDEGKLVWYRMANFSLSRPGTITKKSAPIQVNTLPKDLTDAINTLGRYGIVIPVECQWKINGKTVNL